MNNHVAAHGTYLLLLECDKQVELTIGKLGNVVTEPGYYLYVGSAFGPGGIQARINHHKRIALRPHWHIDYLRMAADLTGVWCSYDVRCEHVWADELMKFEDTVMPLKGFGSSDCDCASHLFYFRYRPLKIALEKLLKNKLETIDNQGMLRASYVGCAVRTLMLEFE
jgi:Uri superfamily endonuclease